MNIVRDNVIIFSLKLINCPLFISIAGLWSGFLFCVLLQFTVFIVFLCKLNWKKATEEVSNSTGGSLCPGGILIQLILCNCNCIYNYDKRNRCKFNNVECLFIFKMKKM